MNSVVGDHVPPAYKTVIRWRSPDDTLNEILFHYYLSVLTHLLPSPSFLLLLLFSFTSLNERHHDLTYICFLFPGETRIKYPALN
ncbi:uncharacterized protein BDW43DRAFT_207930 [Aspergillus alliaceus]|uniref:uncharacterized protein n=1 Tax=Petromyces alliaceus TaxID=209559 RepID=UPI0012A74C59|nr:uncharacterized protein BDW43DRAFT_207930 [Aspergillus alliaceus]KAB8228789.1 hypothetical protein BDW43DRAFT_207930 [Aspergillus alliaceus]